MNKDVKSEEIIIIIFRINPFTGEVIINNCTRYTDINVDIIGDVDVDANGSHVLSINSTIIFKK